MCNQAGSARAVQSAVMDRAPGRAEARLRSGCLGRVLLPGLLRRRPPGSPAPPGAYMPGAARCSSAVVADGRRPQRGAQSLSVTRVESNAMGSWSGAVRVRTRDCGVGPRAEHRPKDCGNSGGGDRGLWMRGAGLGLGEDRGLGGLWTCQDVQAEVPGVSSWRGERRRLRLGLLGRGAAEGRRMRLGRRDPEPAL